MMWDFIFQWCHDVHFTQYTAKLSSGKTLAVRVQNCHSLGKLLRWHACRLTLPINKAIICGKILTIE